MDAFECLWKGLINLFVTMALELVQFLKDRNTVFPYKSVMEIVTGSLLWLSAALFTVRWLTESLF